jgi:hypothetical protein
VRWPSIAEGSRARIADPFPQLDTAGQLGVGHQLA